MDPTDQVSDPSSPAPISDPIGLSERLSSAVALLQSELAGMGHAAACLDQRSAELEERERIVADQSARLEQAEQALAERARELREEQERLTRLADECRTREDRLTAWESSLAERESALAAKESAWEARQRQDTSRDRTQQEPDAQAARLAEAANILAIRRERLRRQRALLSQRAEVLLRAKEALTQRLAETQRLTDTQRFTLLKPASIQRPNPLSRRTTIIHAGGIAATGLSAILGVSWWLAGILDRPVYLAQTMLSMEAVPESAEGATDSWHRFHEDLARDPHLVQVTAERMKRRGREDLASPSDMRAYLADHLAMDAPAPGKVRVTLTGTGRDRTLRLLETFVSAMVTLANDSRDRRLDRANTLVVSPPAADAEPVRSRRIPLFAVTGAGLATISLAGASWFARGRTRRSSADPSAPADDPTTPKSWSIPVS